MKHGAGKYFGPYTSAAAVKDTIELLCKLYKVRTCNRNLPKDEARTGRVLIIISDSVMHHVRDM